MLLRFTPILLALIVGLVMYRFSAWRTGRDLDQRSTLLEDPELLALTRKMAKQLDLPRLKIFIFEVEPVNGLAAPDGRIFITRGFYNKYKSGEVTSEELASVIAHELGHVALGHSRRRMIDFSGQNAMRVALSMVLGRFIPFFGVYIANFIVGLLAAGLSRKDEFEADAYAAALMEKSGIGLYPQISLFRKLETWTPSGGGSAAWLMSHPKTQNRIDAIQRLEKAWKSPPAQR